MAPESNWLEMWIWVMLGIVEVGPQVSHTAADKLESPYFSRIAP
jgi:hypothetical protein